MAQRVGRGIALLFHDRGTRNGWVVSSTPRPHFTPGKDSVPILQEAGRASGPVWTGGKSRPHRDSIPDRPARSQSLYRLSYPSHKFLNYTLFINNEKTNSAVLISSCHFTILTFSFQTLSFYAIQLPEGWTGEACEPTKELMVFLLPSQDSRDSLFLFLSLSSLFYCDLTAQSAGTNDVLFNESYRTLTYAVWGKCCFFRVKSGGTYTNHWQLKS